MQSHYDSAGRLQREFFIGRTNAEMLQAMDERRAQLEREGASGFHRTKVGRNATCPCGSGLKFKKCCIGKAHFTG